MTTKLKTQNAGVKLLLVFIAPCLFACSSPPPEQASVPDYAAAAVTEEEARPDNTQSILTAVADALGRRDYETALAHFDRLESDVADSSDILLLKASTLVSAGKTAEGRTIAERIVSEEPDNTEALYVLSTMERALGKEREQKALLERLLQLDPNHVRALIALGDIAFRARSLSRAASYYDTALEAEPDNGDALVGRAGVYRYQRNPKQAESLLNRAVALYPQWTKPLTDRARLYQGAGFYTDALNDLDRAQKINGNDYWIAVDRGIVLVDLNRKEDALAEFNRAIAMNPDIFLPYVYSAGIKDDFGDFEGAERDYTVLARLNPEYYFAFEGVGVHKMRKGLWAEARDNFMEAYKQSPDTTSYALLASLCWMRAGRVQDPKPFLTQALKRVQRDSLDYALLRLYQDLNGDSDVAMRLDKETDVVLKARMLYYLASYYDVRGSTTLANRYYTQIYQMGRLPIIEWRLNEMVMDERNLKAF
ncbi:MAG: tetratricopeptide repeat protein [Treponema sp.]|jgi:tetratricopeptide (TPR) repeat protein|nr:tetratricopeptide repeat protein [Treponema sp.]